jgi:hypothetical protein
MTVHKISRLVVPVLTLLAFFEATVLAQPDGAMSPMSVSVQPVLSATAEASNKGAEVLIHERLDDPAATFTLVDEKAETDGGRELNGDSPVGKIKKPANQDKVFALKKEILELQNRNKLGFRKIVLCSKVERFGVYSPLPPGKLARKVVVYFEPANVSTLITKDRYIIDCTVDFIVLGPSSKPAASRTRSLKLHRVARSPVLDFYFKLNIDFKVPPKKTLSLKAVLHDNIKNQSTGVTINLKVGGKNKFQDPV